MPTPTPLGMLATVIKVPWQAARATNKTYAISVPIKSMSIKLEAVQRNSPRQEALRAALPI